MQLMPWLHLRVVLILATRCCLSRGDTTLLLSLAAEPQQQQCFTRCKKSILHYPIIQDGKVVLNQQALQCCCVPLRKLWTTLQWVETATTLIVMPLLQLFGQYSSIKHAI
jgi:hypothetical protein